MTNYTCRLISVVLFSILLNNLQAQESDWVSDSLSFYTQKLDAAILAEDFEELEGLYKILYNEGSRSLHPDIYDRFYQDLRNPKVRQNAKLLAYMYNDLGNMEYYRSRFDAAKQAFVNAMEQYQIADLKSDAAGMAMNLGVILERGMKYDSAILNYEKAIPIFIEMKDTTSIANCYENISLSHSYKGDLAASMKYLNMADSVLRSNTPRTDPRWTSLYYNKSRLYALLGENDKAMEFAFDGLRLSETLDNDRLINTGYMMLEDVYENIDDSENWIKYVRKALVFARKSQNGMRQADLEYNLAYHFLDEHEADSAEYYLNEAFGYYEQNDYSEGVSRGYILKGLLHYEKEEYREAIKDFNVAMVNLESTGSKEVARAYRNLGSSYLKLGQPTKAEEYLLQSLEAWMATGEHASISDTYEILAENSKALNNYKDAFHYAQKHKEYADSAFNEAKSKQIAELETVYETEKKDQEIAGLQQEREIQQLIDERKTNQIYLAIGGLVLVMSLAFFFYKRARLKHRANKLLELKNDEIASQNAEKEMLLKEIHHRVKNNLQIISSLLSMQTRTLRDTHAIGAMKESQSRVKTMALIHEKLYQYDNLARINMKEYMNQLSDFLAHTYRTDKEINVVIQADDVSLDIDTAVPLGLIANELLSNAWKYAFQNMEQGEIRIILEQNGEHAYRLEISDTGNGISNEVDLEKSKSLGLKLVRSLTRQIHGNLTIQSTPGATFMIDFKETSLVA